MNDNNPISFIQWLSRIVNKNCNCYTNLCLLEEIQDESFYYAKILTQINIDTHRIGIRKYVVVGVDTKEQALCLDQVPEELELYGAELGVISRYFVHNGDQNQEVYHRLHSIGVLPIKVDAIDSEIPEDKITFGFGNFLLGTMVEHITERYFNELKSNDKPIVSNANNMGIIQHAYLSMIVICLSEEAVFNPEEAGRTEVSMTSSGDISELSAEYAVKRYPDICSFTEYFFPNGKTLHKGQQQILNIYADLYHIKPHPDFEDIHSVLQKLAFAMLKYFNSWLNGHTSSLIVTDIRQLFKKLRDLPLPEKLIEELIDAPPPDQIMWLNIIMTAKLYGGISFVYRLLEEASPKVEETCIKALSALGEKPGLSFLARYASSPRDSVSNAALNAISKIESEEAALLILDLININKVKLSEYSIMALAKTHTLVALEALIQFGTKARGNVPLLGLNECLNHQINHENEPLHGDQKWLLDIAEKFYAMEEFAVMSRRIAMMIIYAFRIEKGAFLLHKALSGKCLRTRIFAMKYTAAFPTEKNAEAIVQSANNPPDDYQRALITDLIVAKMDVAHKRDGSNGAFASTGELNLSAAARKALKFMGNDLYLKYAKQLSEPEPSDPQKGVENQSAQTEIPALRSVSQNELIYALPQGGHVWLTHLGDKKDNDDSMIATVIHNNKLSSTPTGPTASAMLGGGTITTVGPKNQLINDVVWKCLRGQEPKVPIAVGMDEFIKINQETGEREQFKLGEKDIDE